MKIKYEKKGRKMKEGSQERKEGKRKEREGDMMGN